jgi:hypothetical protein
MTGRTLMIRALAATAGATATLAFTAAVHATPTGPCADVPYVGVCVPISEQPSPPTQHSYGEVVLAPDTSSGSQAFS